MLLAMRQDTDYIDHWCACLELDPDARRAVDFYALVYCVRFMGTAGQRLNGNYSIQTDPSNLGVLEGTARKLLANLD